MSQHERFPTMTFTRRHLMAVAPAAFAAMHMPAARAQDEAAFFAGASQDNGFSYRKTNMAKIDPVWRKQLVHYTHSEEPGTIVVDSKAHFLYVAFENNTALRYG